MDTTTDPFPVTWDSLEDAQNMWFIDAVHCPAPMSPLDFDLRMCPLATGNSRSNALYGMPLNTEPKLIYGFVYQKIVTPELPPEAFPDALRAADARVRQVGRELGSRWENTWLPEIRAHLDYLTAFDLRAANLAELRAHLREVKLRIERLWEIHAQLLLPTLVALSDFEEAYRDLFPAGKPLDVYELLSGFPNKTLEANIRLWELGRAAARTPSLRVRITESAVADLPLVLAESPQGRALWSEVQAYVTTYGERNDDLYIDHPTWIEAITPVLHGIREAVLQPDRDLAGELQQKAALREVRLAEVRAQLASSPGPVIEEFEALLTAAQVATVLSEDHHFWLDCKITYHARRVSLAVGGRLAELFAIASPDDVFYLTLAELTEGPEPVAGSFRDAIAARRSVAVRFAGATPPTFLGVPRMFLPLDCAIMKASFKFNGNLMAPPDSGGVLHGMPGASGRVTGPARIVRTIEDAAKLRPGDILVAAATLPSWTPFFASAVGVVTNIGGVLCHAAVVAREYRIPAVVGTRSATDSLQDGQLIEVDGDAGIVRVLAS